MFRQSQATILLTRPLLQSQRFADEIGGALISPLMQPEFLSPAIPPLTYSALILTSETGAEAARRISASGFPLPTRAYCVGNRTAAAAQAAGFQTLSAEGNADDLLALITQDAPQNSLLFMRATDTAGNLQERLLLAGIDTVSAIAYRQNPTHLSPAATSLLQQNTPVILPLFSPRSAQLLTQELHRITATAPLYLAALSPAVAQAFAWPTAQIQIAAQPNSAAMIKAITLLRHEGIGS
jgi:uroporphyrinogen-III synthase